jgi:hypothetical protein
MAPVARPEETTHNTTISSSGRSIEGHGGYLQARGARHLARVPRRARGVPVPAGTLRLLQWLAEAAHPEPAVLSLQAWHPAAAEGQGSLTATTAAGARARTGSSGMP